MLSAVRLAMWFVPCSFLLRRFLLEKPKPGSSALDDRSIERIAWSVRLSSRYVPASTCLTQALTAILLLSRRGHQADLKIGVSKGEENKLRAHAWVESNGRIVIGNVTEITRFKVLSTSEEQVQ
jgi:hypothetical protein